MRKIGERWENFQNILLEIKGWSVEYKKPRKNYQIKIIHPLSHEIPQSPESQQNYKEIDRFNEFDKLPESL